MTSLLLGIKKLFLFHFFSPCLLQKQLQLIFFWRFFERCGAQFVAFFVSIILARLLDPAVYGEIALITVFTCILQVFVDSGLGSALIQKKNADDLDFSSVFYFNIAVCLVLYGVMFVAAPFIADFYHIPHLPPVIRVLSLTLIVSVSYPNKKLLAYDYLAQLQDMFPQIALSCIMGVCVYCIQFVGLNDVFTLALQIVAGIVIYTLLSKLFNIESFNYIFNTILKVMNRKNSSFF